MQLMVGRFLSDLNQIGLIVSLLPNAVDAVHQIR